MRGFLKAACTAALLATAGCGDDVVYVPLVEFATVPLHGEFGYYDDGTAPGAHAAGFVELDRHRNCSALNEDYTARFNGQRIEAAMLGGLQAGGGDSGPSCSWPTFTVVETRRDALPATFSDGEFALEDSSHRMRMRVRDWVGPHGPVLPEGTVEVQRGEEITVPWLPASADLSALAPQLVVNGGLGESIPMRVEAGTLRLGTSNLAAGTHTLGFAGFAQLEVLECVGTPECGVFVRPHYQLHTLQVRVLSP